MKKVILLFVAVAGLGALLMAQPCIAGWCTTNPCFNSRGCGQCVCMSRDTSGGICVDLRAAERMRAAGAVELE